MSDSDIQYYRYIKSILLARSYCRNKNIIFLVLQKCCDTMTQCHCHIVAKVLRHFCDTGMSNCALFFVTIRDGM